MKADSIFLIVIFLILGGVAFGQGLPISTTDTVWVDSIGAHSGDEVILDVLFINADTLHGMEVPLAYSSPDIVIDSVSFVNSRVNILSFTFSSIYPEEQQIHIGAIGLDSTSILPPGRGVLASLYITIPVTAPVELIEFDSTYIPPSTLIFASKTDDSFIPQFRKGYIDNDLPLDAAHNPDPMLPTEFHLAQNRPNPFNPSTDISFALPRKDRVRLEVYNLLGQKVRTLLDETMTPGSHTVIFDGYDDEGNQIASGVYFYRIKTTADTQTRKMIMLK